MKYIISDADGFLEVKDEGGYDNENSYDWLLYYLWAIKLKNAYRLGVPKNYISKSNKLSVVRGNIDVVDYFLNKGSGKYLCNYREHSYNTNIAKLINLVFEKIANHNFLSGMRPIRDSFLVATEGEKPFFTDLMKTRQIDNPYYQDYNPVIDLSKKILQHKGLSFGSSSNSSAFLFDISMLFEYFIRKLLLKNGINLISKNDDLRIPTGSERYIRKLIPDIVTEDKDGLSVFDVKYKNFDPIYGVKREDLFQIHTYIGQIGNKFKVKKAGFIYPYKGDKNIINQQKMNLMGKEIEFYLIRIAVPTSQDSEDFKAIFKNNCDDFIEFFKNKN